MGTSLATKTRREFSRLKLPKAFVDLLTDFGLNPYEFNGNRPKIDKETLREIGNMALGISLRYSIGPNFVEKTVDYARQYL